MGSSATRLVLVPGFRTGFPFGAPLASPPPEIFSFAGRPSAWPAAALAALRGSEPNVIFMVKSEAATWTAGWLPSKYQRPPRNKFAAMGCPAASTAALMAALKSSGESRAPGDTDSGSTSACTSPCTSARTASSAAISGRDCAVIWGIAAGAADPIITASDPADVPFPKGVGKVEDSVGELWGTARGPGASAVISGLPNGPLRTLSAAKGEIERGGSGARRTGGADVVGDCP